MKPAISKAVPRSILTLIACLTLCKVAAEDKIDFAHHIVPIIRKSCGKCHTGEKKKGGLSMNTRDLLLKGSENGEIVKPGNAEESILYRVVTTEDPELAMPPKGERVSPQEAALLKKWITEGLTWEPGFTFGKSSWEPPLKPRRPDLPLAIKDRTNPIDRILDDQLAQQKMPQPATMEDSAFIRRLFMDVIGLLPTPEELNSFLTDAKSENRQRLINTVLANDIAYAEHWLTFWNDLLRNDYTGTGFITGGRKQVTNWLYSSLVNNKPYDQFVRELISPNVESEGFIKGIKWRGEVNSSQTTEIQFAQNISQVFLGINLKCASCHDSFIDRWKLEEAYNLAAVYSNNPLEIHRCDKPTGKNAEPAWLFPELGQVDPKASPQERLKQLSELMTHSENGRLPRTIVNRIWHRLMGRGIVHPVDAMHTEPWNEDLLDFLAVYLVDNKYDLKKTIELIVSSQAYQSKAVVQQSEPGPGAYSYTGPLPKRMTAEQFIDAVWQVTGAGSTRNDAKVFRGKLEQQKGDEQENIVKGKWIWSEDQSKPAQAGESVTFRKQFELKEFPENSAAVITCDNEYILYVNGIKVGEDKEWPTVEHLPIGAALKVGMNTILVVARNAGDSPNMAALFLQTQAKDIPSIFSDDTWQWTVAIPDSKGRFKEQDVEWKPAVLVARQDFLGPQVVDQIRLSLAQSLSTTKMFVRASLVNNDFLMRSLGRPHREQVVTTRPAELTTLQAIDLQNGEIMADTLRSGAKKLVARRQQSAGEFVNWLYQYALSRIPSSEEAAVSQELLEGTPGEQGVEDLLWAILMLPEFQFVR